MPRCRWERESSLSGPTRLATPPIAHADLLFFPLLLSTARKSTTSIPESPSRGVRPSFSLVLFHLPSLSLTHPLPFFPFPSSAKKHDVPVEKLLSKVLIEKFQVSALIPFPVLPSPPFTSRPSSLFPP